MNPERLVAGLDIGSAKTTAVIAEVVGDLPRSAGVKILGVGQARTSGMPTRTPLPPMHSCLPAKGSTSQIF